MHLGVWLLLLIHAIVKQRLLQSVMIDLASLGHTIQKLLVSQLLLSLGWAIPSVYTLTAAWEGWVRLASDI